MKKFDDYNYIHFITTKTFIDSFFKDKKCCEILIEELDFYRRKLGFKILGYVIMPDHVHLLIWWDVEKYQELTSGKIMQGVKGYTAKKIIEYYKQSGRCQQLLASTRRGDQERLHYRNLQYKIWQKDFYDFNIFTQEKFQEKLDYIHKNPLRAGLVENLEDYKWSSFNCFYNNDCSVLRVDELDFVL